MQNIKNMILIDEQDTFWRQYLNPGVESQLAAHLPESTWGAFLQWK